jgi:hypothetical protein
MKFILFVVHFTMMFVGQVRRFSEYKVEGTWMEVVMA